jgi:hypothetical protein
MITNSASRRYLQITNFISLLCNASIKTSNKITETGRSTEKTERKNIGENNTERENDKLGKGDRQE